MRLLLLCGLAGSLAAQQDSSEDAKTLLLEVRKKLMLTLTSLPKYMCTETIDRAMFEPQVKLAAQSCDDLAGLKKRKGWTVHKYESDRLRLDVAVSDEAEMYSWAGEHSFEDRKLSKLVLGGVTATGEFSAFISSIFGTSAASFTYNGDVSADGRKLVEFGYSVPLEHSKYRISKKLQTATVAFDGTFLADPKTFNLVRLTVHADQLPQELQSCDISTTLDYSSLQINNSQFLLPSAVRLHILEADGVEADNRTVFTSCHEFLGESSLHFEDSPTPQATNPEASSQTLPLPAGIQFRFALAQPIDPANAAAGDSFKARLTSAIKDKQDHVLVPKGTAVIGRILRMKWLYGLHSQSLQVALKLETVEVDGVPRAFDTRMESTVKRHINSTDFSAVRQTLGSFDQMDQDDPGVGFLEFPNVSQDYVIKRGLEIEAMTAAPSSKPLN